MSMRPRPTGGHAVGAGETARPEHGHRLRWVSGVGCSLVLIAGAVLAAREPRSRALRADGGGVLWTAGGSRPLQDEWASYTTVGAPGRPTTVLTRPSRIRVVEARGRRAYALTVHAGDRDRYTAAAQRTELGQGNPSRSLADLVDRAMYAGQDRWIAEELLIPAGAPTGDHRRQWYVVSQMKIAGAGGPALALDFEDGRLTVDHAAEQRAGSDGQVDLWTSAPVARDRWLRILWHVRWSTGRDGFVELFGDVGDGRGYRRLMPRRVGWTLKHGADGGPGVVHSRIGIYRRAIDAETTVYFAGYTVATTRRAAEAAAGFGPQARRAP